MGEAVAVADHEAVEVEVAGQALGNPAAGAMGEGTGGVASEGRLGEDDLGDRGDALTDGGDGKRPIAALEPVADAIGPVYV